MDAKEIVGNLRKGNIDSTINEFIINRTMPLPKKEFIEALYFLTKDSVFKERALKEIDRLDIESFENYLKEKTLIPEVALFLYNHFKNKIKRKTLVEILNNFSIPSQVLMNIAKSDDSELLELLSIKEVKLLAHPEIIDVLISNPNLSRERRFRLIEMKKRFILGEEDEGEEREETKEAEAEVEEEKEEGEEDYDDSVISVELDMEDGIIEQKINLNMIKKMTVGEKIKFALFGNKEVRKILINDPNRLVREAVLQSPKLTDAEIESFAKLKSLSDDVIRRITLNKQWTSKYSVALSLIKNPKTPISFSLNYLDKLIVRDLKQIQKDKDIPEPVRKKAKILIERKFG